MISQAQPSTLTLTLVADTITDATTGQVLTADVYINGALTYQGVSEFQVTMPLDGSAEIRVVAPGYAPWGVRPRGGGTGTSHRNTLIDRFSSNHRIGIQQGGLNIGWFKGISVVLTEIYVRRDARYCLQSFELVMGLLVLIGESAGETIYGQDNDLRFC